MALVNTPYTMNCIMCGAENDEKETSTYCTVCGGVLSICYEKTSSEIQYPLKTLTPDPLKNYPTALKYLSRLSKTYGAELYAKLEFENPTGCFKDRGSYIEVQKALELGADAICLASTGNMAASVAAYSCYFKIPCFVFVPEKTSEAKLAQATIYNANIIKIKGDFSTCEKICREFARSGNYYLAGDYVFREEGQKSFTYELLEQGGVDFDFIFVPIGAGTNFAAIFKGFKEIKDGGVIDRIPRFVAVQPEESSPVVEGIFKKEKVVKDFVNTMAESVAVSNPFDFYKVLRGIEETNGLAFTATENELLECMKEMAVEEGHFTEPACAIPLACFKNNIKKFKGKKCLFVLTGTGLKSARTIAKYSFSSPVLSPKIDRVLDFINSGFLEMQKQSWGQARETLMPNLKMDDAHSRIYDEYIQNIKKKGKTLRDEEIKALKNLVFNEETDLEYPVEVMDYKVTMRKNGLVEATVKLKTGDAQTTATCKGVGPMDAILSAIKSQTDSFLPVEIINHEVEILSPDTDSLVVVTLTLSRAGHEFSAKAASPDTLDALIQAFVKALAISNKVLS